ncbi:MAG: ATP-binding protein [Gemmatimonadota bacterium]
MTLQRALFILIAALLLAALIPGGIALERRVAAALEQRAREDMSLMPRVLRARQASAADAMMMHAKELASTPGLAEALQRGDRARAIELLESARGQLGHASVLVAADGVWHGPDPGTALVDHTRAGEMPVQLVSAADTVRTLALSPIMVDGQWIGAAGYGVNLDRTEAGILAGLTRADVIVRSAAGRLAATTRDSSDAAAILRSVPGVAADRVLQVRINGRRLLVATAPAGANTTVFFVRELDAELAVLPRLRQIALASIGGALIVALLLAALLATMLSRPVVALAHAADRLAVGDFAAPLPRPGVREFGRLAAAFDQMRGALQHRLEELQGANRELADRQARLGELQAELVQRERLATAGRLVSQLAHEVRNPVANVRNCLELLRRRVGSDTRARELADMATDELLRMHELAERLLDLHRPNPRNQDTCDPLQVSYEVAALVRISTTAVSIDVCGDDGLTVALSPDALKQVLHTLVQNAQEAMAGQGRIEIRVTGAADRATIEVTDSGPGIAADVLPRVFDPFFTTKSGVHGVGLGLFVAEGIVRSHGGRVQALNVRPNGACFSVTVPLAATEAVPMIAAEGTVSA